MDAVLFKYNTLQDRYDAQTAHGARQGAMLIVPGVRLPLGTTCCDALP